MHLLHSVVVLCAVALAASLSVDLRQDVGVPVTESTGSNEVTEKRPTILENFGKRGFGRVVVTAYHFLEVLDDPDVSNKFYDLIAGRKEIMRVARTCVEKNVVDFLNDNTNSVGGMLSIVRMGQPPITKLSDLRSINLMSLAPILWFSAQSFDLDRALEEGGQLAQDVADNCLNGELKEYKADVEFIIDAIEAKVLSKRK